MFPLSGRTATAFAVLLVCALLPSSVSWDNVSEGRSGSGTIRELWAAVADLAEEGRLYLGRLAGEQTILSVQKAFSQVLSVVVRSLAAGLNVLLQYVSHLLQAAGIKADFSKVTPEGLIFVGRWALVALVGYWLLSVALRLVVSVLRRALWMLKVSVALALFGFILSDRSIDTETMAIRLAILVFVCVVLGVGASRGSDDADKTARLEEQISFLERRLREMERWRRTEE